MKKRKMTYLVMAAALLAACSSDKEGQEPEGRLPISLGYTTVELDQTRAANNVNETQFTSGTVKVNKKKHSEDSWGTAVDYTAGTGGTLTAETPFYYESDGSTVDIIAYYPSTAGTSFSVAPDQSSDEDYQASDLMWATPIVNQSRTPATVTLQLNHKMAKISVKPIIGTGVTKITKITLKSIKQTVTFDQTTGVVGAASGDATEIIVANNETDGLTTNTYYAALIPSQTLAAGAFVEITADGQAATYSLAASKAFLAGHQYSLDITVEASALNATNAITNWDNTEAATVASANLTNPLVIAAIDDQAYTGSAIEPNVSVSFNGNTLASDNYNVYYVDNINPGKATAVVSYNGEYGTREFNIIVPSTLTELKEWINASKAFSKCLGYYVTSTGDISDSSTGAIGIIAYLSASDVDTSLSGTQNGLILALSDESSSMAWADTYEESGVTRGGDRTDLAGYGDTQKLYNKYGSNYAGGKCWSKGTAISTLTQTQWFLPSRGQWDLMSGTNGMSAGDWNAFRDMASILNTDQNLMWSSTECDNNVAMHFSVNDGVWRTDHYKNGTYRVRACFAF